MGKSSQQKQLGTLQKFQACGKDLMQIQDFAQQEETEMLNCHQSLKQEWLSVDSEGSSCCFCRGRKHILIWM